MLDGMQYTNSLGMDFLRVEAGTFLMGNDRSLDDEIVRLGFWRYGDPDEQPVHIAHITTPYHVGTTVVTNAQYEMFDPSHRELRGKQGFSSEDDEAVVFVSWNDAVGFCEWLSEKEGILHRLPSEAEWEYACRADTKGAYSLGETLPDSFRNNVGQVWYPRSRSDELDHPTQIKIKQTPPNPWGLYDMHGLVEEWCQDWYAPYSPKEHASPLGPETGDFRVTRGGSHSTEMYYLRSSNRAGTLPDERSWYVGFRVVIGEHPTQYIRARSARVEQHQLNVLPGVPQSIGEGPDHDIPLFRGPVKYVHIANDEYGRMFGEHNHCPGFTECPNGDLLAIWYTCVEEPGRELGIAASRLRYDRKAGRLADEWDPSSVFWDAPDRNDHASALFSDGERLYHFNGLSACGTWGPLAMIQRTSEDSGATWSDARYIAPEHDARHMPIAGAFALNDGTIVLPCDAVIQGVENATALWISGNRGETWRDAGGNIAGIHAGVVELHDGSWLAYGRAADIDGRMAQSVSSDRGASWEYSASPFLRVVSSQRVVLRRMKGKCAAGSDPLLLISFSSEPVESPNAMHITDEDGVERPIYGMYAAISFDDGKTWPHIRPISDDGPERTIEGMDGMPHRMGPSCAEYNGYIAGVQARNGVFHLISSRNHYSFNMAWLSQRAPGLK
jgi:formylglycine-generating enzyme